MSTQLHHTLHADGGVPIKAWIEGVPLDEGARRQLGNMAKLSIVGPWIAVMPDVHLGIGATVGSVVPTEGAIIPAAVGVDIGCGMMAYQTTLQASQLPDNLFGIRSDVERAVPHGFVTVDGRSAKGNWIVAPNSATTRWRGLEQRYRSLVERHPRISHKSPLSQLGSLGGGNHFIELCLDENDQVWVMLHSGSRGVGNGIGQYFIERARNEMQRQQANLPDRDLAYLSEGSVLFDDYVEAVGWAQEYAAENRQQMMETVLGVLRKQLPSFQLTRMAINCHHNYVQRETHFGRELLITRKGAVSARKDQLGIIPGSMGAKSFIVRGLGNEESFCSCSHGAGRVMSRTEAKKRITLGEHRAATAHVECRKDADVVDESPAAYKPIDQVMAAQRDLVEIVHTLRQVVCVKG
ncbi:tRNA-splicing ligase RtcB [Tahibacter aquaticus]|uniref:3'-phosphate/5'-hydroxy nucleic acid ligase n=1 Tax=Tahibacter aquaticus TaxID=520092 RepID=A0A4R6Z6P1_9GAMM|nr:RtcB family protein [Tahibacter aquaticus]TDR47402.1 tRNA-splicing ligase RtcB [Tahibacter aquaticus]